ncbi:autoinducer binding domain-containing protein [Mesorhizobium sp.]|uniref:autoinducer binding domain-containing protein n=1 Tax=Mesorhizobium sp. TaxID=1871066 RepID=UPI00344A7257
MERRIHANTTEDERCVFDEAAVSGLKSGMSVPLHGPEARFAVMSFARSDGMEIQSRAMNLLQLAASRFHTRIVECDNSHEQHHLSMREKVALRGFTEEKHHGRNYYWNFREYY